MLQTTQALTSWSWEASMPIPLPLLLTAGRVMLVVIAVVVVFDQHSETVLCNPNDPDSVASEEEDRPSNGNIQLLSDDEQGREPDPKPNSDPTNDDEHSEHNGKNGNEPTKPPGHRLRSVYRGHPVYTTQEQRNNIYDALDILTGIVEDSIQRRNASRTPENRVANFFSIDWTDQTSTKLWPSSK
ncbi:unnamed protein product [Protopolystoma xenopodis]|uniref:Uncharacterized protein n=1 Tax=Protopolystoma xenopodis TaxID=117903 RepID=A0A3S5B599_9PLAT|nr:unnamed protein product [Protopolystoma xenopodis]